MPTFPTPLPAVTRHAHFDNTVVYFVPTIASTTGAATRAELTAGTDLTGEIQSISGFTVTGSDINAPDLRSEFVSKVPGRTTSEDSSISFYSDPLGQDAGEFLPYKTIGFIVTMLGGDVPTGKMNVFPVRVRSVGEPISVGDDLAVITIGFSITREPFMRVAVPANP